MTQERPIHILGISGSLRSSSYNTALLRAAEELLPEDVTMEIVDLAGIPVLDIDEEIPFPEAVVRMRTAIAEADAVLIATPEYNSSISGALKNALDWVSRSPQPPLAGKPVALIGASTGLFGTARAQVQLRQVLTHLGALVLSKPEVMVPKAQEVFDENGRLTSESTRRFLQDLLIKLAVWTRRVAH